MTRWKASTIHLILSILALAAIAAILVWRWYPPGLFHVAKADKLFLIIAGVDVVIGPLLTLIVYKQGKKSLRFDLAVIALLQIAAMAYGLHTVWQSRPVYLVGATDRFQLVFANEIDREDLQYAKPEFQVLPKLSVRTIGSLPPTKGDMQAQAINSALAGKDVYLIPHFHVPYDVVASTILSRAMPAAELASRLDGDDAKQVSKAIRSNGRPAAELAAVPIDSTRGSATMLLDARDGGILGPIAVDPWEAFHARQSEHTRHPARPATAANPTQPGPGAPPAK